jgi:hypothetical protein
MGEVEKMYENAGFEIPIARLKIFKNDNGEIYTCPPFAAEKQIELIKLLMEQDDFSWAISQQGKVTEYAFYVGYEYSSGDFKEFTEALAGIINNLWQDLAEEEKQQVKGILE